MNMCQVYRRCIFFSAAALLIFAPARAADELRTVKKVYSGNRIKLQAQKDAAKEVRVRYIGVDAPPNDKPFFKMCRDANKALVEGRLVRIQTDRVAVDPDGRQLVYVYVDQVFVNAELIKNGYGLVAEPDGNVQHHDFFLGLQQEARKNRRGLWAFEDQSDEPYYVGSKSGKIFHRPTCPHVKGLAFDDSLIFRSKAEALSAGYRQDWRCCPLFKKTD
jgi:micrococcal nuclease